MYKSVVLIVFFCMYFVCFIIVDAFIDVVGGVGVVGTCGVVLLMVLKLRILLLCCC